MQWPSSSVASTQPWPVAMCRHRLSVADGEITADRFSVMSLRKNQADDSNDRSESPSQNCGCLRKFPERPPDGHRGQKGMVLLLAGPLPTQKDILSEKHKGISTPTRTCLWVQTEPPVCILAGLLVHNRPSDHKAAVAVAVCARSANP